jgi:hypothetical protein
MDAEPSMGTAPGREKAIAALNLASAAERAVSGGHTGLDARAADSGAREAYDRGYQPNPQEDVIAVLVVIGKS